MLTIPETLQEYGLGPGRHPGTHFVIQGGYFDADKGVDAFSRASLQRAFEIGALLATADPSRRIGFDVLVNDLGAQCNDTLCTPGNGPHDEAALHAMLAEIRLLAERHGQQVTLTTERHMRNWALRRLRKLLAAPDRRQQQPRLHSVPLHEAGHRWQLDSRFGAPIVLFEERGDRWVGKCPAIMGGYYAYTLERMAPDTLAASKVVIDLCSPADRDKVSKGAEAAFSLLRPPHRASDLLMPVVCDTWCEHLFPRAYLSRDFLPR